MLGGLENKTAIVTSERAAGGRQIAPSVRQREHGARRGSRAPTASEVNTSRGGHVWPHSEADRLGLMRGRRNTHRVIVPVSRPTCPDGSNDEGQ